MCRYNRLYLSDPTRSNFVINPFALTGRIFACVSIYSSLSLSLSLSVCVWGCARAVGVCQSLFIPAFPIRAVPFCPVCAYPTLCTSSYTVYSSLCHVVHRLCVYRCMAPVQCVPLPYSCRSPAHALMYTIFHAVSAYFPRIYGVSMLSIACNYTGLSLRLIFNLQYIAAPWRCSLYGRPIYRVAVVCMVSREHVICPRQRHVVHTRPIHCKPVGRNLFQMVLSLLPYLSPFFSPLLLLQRVPLESS